MNHTTNSESLPSGAMRNGASLATTADLSLSRSLAYEHSCEGAPFKIKPYGFGQLAQMYYPDHNYDSALRHFREEMHLTRGMWDAMTAVGYREKQKLLTRSQVKTIVEFLGEP